MYIYIYIIHLSKCLRQNVFKIKVFASKERKMLIINSIHLGFQTWWVESANFNELFCLFEKMISPKYLKKWTSCLETSCTSRSFQVNWSIASDISRKKTILNFNQGKIAALKTPQASPPLPPWKNRNIPCSANDFHWRVVGCHFRRALHLPENEIFWTQMGNSRGHSWEVMKFQWGVTSIPLNPHKFMKLYETPIIQQSLFWMRIFGECQSISTKPNQGSTRNPGSAKETGCRRAGETDSRCAWNNQS